MSNQPYTPEVHLQGYKHDNEDQIACDLDDSEIQGFCVFVKRNFIIKNGHGEPFDLIQEQEFDNEDDARDYARELTREHQCELMEL